jgi:hypothetical protein
MQYLQIGVVKISYPKPINPRNKNTNQQIFSSVKKYIIPYKKKKRTDEAAHENAQSTLNFPRVTVVYEPEQHPSPDSNEVY